MIRTRYLAALGIATAMALVAVVRLHREREIIIAERDAWREAAEALAYEIDARDSGIAYWSER